VQSNRLSDEQEALFQIGETIELDGPEITPNYYAFLSFFLAGCFIADGKRGEVMLSTGIFTFFLITYTFSFLAVQFFCLRL